MEKMGRAGATVMQPTSATSRQSGFTLLELIVGLTVGAILLTAIYATFVGVSQTQRRVETVLDQTASWRFVTETIRLDLARLKSTSTFTGSQEEFEADLFEGIEGVPIRVRYTWEDAKLTRTAGDRVLIVDLPEGYQQPAFSYGRDGEWEDKTDALPEGLELQVATPRGALIRAFMLEFDSRKDAQGASG